MDLTFLWKKTRYFVAVFWLSRQTLYSSKTFTWEFLAINHQPYVNKNQYMTQLLETAFTNLAPGPIAQTAKIDLKCVSILTAKA